MNLAELSIKRPIFITSIFLMSIVLGLFSIKKMSVDQFPDVTFPVIFVQTIYPGASPVDMEKLVSKPIEDELGSLSNLNKITSTNSESSSYVILEFKIGTDVRDAEQQIRQRVSNIRNLLPEDIKNPTIRRFDPADQAIVRLAVKSDLEPGKLFDLVNDQLKAQFETIGGVGQINIIGARKREIQVLVDRKKAQDRNLSLLQISDRIKNTSKDVPVGKVTSDGKDMVFRATGEFSSIDSIKEVAVNFLGSDQAVQISDIAEVKEGLEEVSSESYLATKADSFKRTPTLFLDIFKQSGVNTVEVVDAIINKIPKVNEFIKAKSLNAEVSLVRDAAFPIRWNIIDVRESIMIGIILCIVVVFFFLGSVRSTIITGLALPNSLLGGFIIMYAMGFTINILTLLALSLAVGLLIDDAIVVRENIFRHMEKLGKSPMQAALDGTKEVALAVVATTMVVIAVFGPIAFLQGIIGQFFKQFGLTVVFTMLISLFDAFTMAPMLSAYMATKNEHNKQKRFLGGLLDRVDRMQDSLEKFYEKTLYWVLRNRKTTLALAGLGFVLSLGSVAFIPKTFIPHGDLGEFEITVEKPVGTSFGPTREISFKIEEVLAKNPAIEIVETTLGSTATGPSQPNKSKMYVKLVPHKQRKIVTSKVKEQLREQLKPFLKDAIIQITDIDIGGSGQKVFNLAVVGENLDELSKYVEKLKVRLEKVPGMVDVDTNYRTGKPEYHVVFDRKKSEELGVSTSVAGAELRARMEGVNAAVFREEGREYNIHVSLSNEEKDLRKEFKKTQVPNSNYNMIPLEKIARGEETTGYSQINRQNKARYILISANLDSKGNLGEITSQTEVLLGVDPEFKAPPGISYRFWGQAEDFKDLQQNMLMAMFLGVLFIYLVLASLYESFILPFSILIALPLAISGALVALAITGKSLDIFSMIGFIMLLGVVAKNSILLVDYTNILMKEGVPRSQALIRAGTTRLRPILMTSLALISGTIPIAIGLNEVSSQRTSMGVAIIGGLTSSTILTLLVVPAAFGYIDDFKNFVSRVFRKIRGVSEQEPPKTPVRNHNVERSL